MIGGLLNVIGAGISGFFGFKKSQGEAVKQGLEVLGDINSSEAARETAIAKIISSEASSGYWLAAVWRPLLMVFFGVLIGARWFGYMPPNMSEAELFEVYGLLKLGIGGYIGSRGLEKIASNLKLGGILQEYIKKKLI